MCVPISAVKMKWETSQVILICKWGYVLPLLCLKWYQVFISEKYNWICVLTTLGLLLTLGLAFSCL